MVKKVDVNERKDKLKRVMGEINKTLKTDALKFASDEIDKERVAFGIKLIDEFIGGGTTCGNFSIIYGGESVGKSTLVLQQVANAQKQGKITAYIDLEHSFDKQRAVKLGIDLESLVLVENIDTAEQAMDMLIKLAKEKVVDLAIIDSVQAMSPKGEQVTKTGKEKSMEEEEMALLARKLGKFFRVAGTPVYNGKVSVVLVGQVRTQGIGSFITRDGLSGGHGLKHWSLLTLYLRRGQRTDAPTETQVIEYEEDGEIKKDKVKVAIGFDSVIKIEKTKVSGSKIEGSELHLPFLYERGFINEEKI